MFEWLRKWNYSRYEAGFASHEDLAVFESFASGPWTPAMAARMPWDILLKGPQLGGIDADTRRVIDLEVARRFRSRQPLFANLIALVACGVSLIALCRSG